MPFLRLLWWCLVCLLTNVGGYLKNMKYTLEQRILFWKSTGLQLVSCLVVTERDFQIELDIRNVSSKSKVCWLHGNWKQLYPSSVNVEKMACISWQSYRSCHESFKVHATYEEDPYWLQIRQRLILNVVSMVQGRSVWSIVWISEFTILRALGDGKLRVIIERSLHSHKIDVWYAIRVVVDGSLWDIWNKFIRKTSSSIMLLFFMHPVVK